MQFSEKGWESVTTGKDNTKITAVKPADLFEAVHGAEESLVCFNGTYRHGDHILLELTSQIADNTVIIKVGYLTEGLLFGFL